MGRSSDLYKRRAAAQQSPETWPNMEQIDDDDDDDDDDDVLGKYRLVNKNKKEIFLKIFWVEGIRQRGRPKNTWWIVLRMTLKV